MNDISPQYTALCADVNPIPNGDIDYDSDDTPRPVGTVAAYICNDGFYLNGPGNRTCVLVPDGSAVFDASDPSCDRECVYSYLYCMSVGRGGGNHRGIIERLSLTVHNLN